MMRRCLILIFISGLSLASAEACTACFGESNDSLARGMNMGIFALLLVITSVLFGVASFFLYVAKRTSRLEAMASQSANQPFSQNPTNA